MDLFERDDLEVGSAESGLEAAAVFEDVFLAIPIGEPEIENLLAVLSADAAGLGAETVNEPAKFSEGGDLENFEVSGFASDPV
jgi:hypothetical protein